MWPYFTVPLEGHIRQAWLYIVFESDYTSSTSVNKSQIAIVFSDIIGYMFTNLANTRHLEHQSKPCFHPTNKAIKSYAR